MVLTVHWVCCLIEESGTYSVPSGVIVIVVGNGHGDTSSNPGRDWLHFT